MSYQVLARKWRPQRFSEVVGQEHITRTLQNAIAQGRVGHAYLFVGPRGIGKTTSARIFAKALNCEQGETPEPCCECESCREIAAGSSLDVIEIDGASHNKVEDIRDIRDNVQYTPSHSRYKIYVIDEVHMLTTSAWNALLKTLEEPPPHVKFLFATTEPHKVLPTIVSRCQRFDLKRLSVPQIVDRLRQIADPENIHVEDQALAAIARAADGGMRDAQSIFDQMIAFCGGKDAGSAISEQDVIDVFGLASGAELRTVAEGMLSNDLNAVLTVVQALADRGRDLERLYSDLVAFMRNLMICSVCPDPGQLLQASAGELVDLRQLAGGAEPGLLQRLLQGLVTEEWSFRSALNRRVYLEATLARVVYEAHSIQIDDVISRLNELRSGSTVPLAPEAGVPQPRSPARALPQTASQGRAQDPTRGPDPRPDPPPPVPPPAAAPPEPEVTGDSGVRAPEPTRSPSATPPTRNERTAAAPAVTDTASPGPMPRTDVEPPEASAEGPDPGSGSEDGAKEGARVVGPARPERKPTVPSGRLEPDPEPSPTTSPAEPADHLMASSPGGPDLPALTPTTQNEPRTPSSLTSDSPSPVAAEPEAANAVREQPETGPPTDSEDHAPQGTTHDPVSPALDAQDVAKREAPMLPSFPATEAASPPSGTQPAVAETVPANTPETQADELWQRLIQEVGKLPGEGLTRARMEALRPVAFRGGTLHVGSDDSVPSEHRDYLQSKERAKVLDTCLARLLPGVGRNVLIKRFIAGVSTEDPPPRRRRASPEVREAVGRDAFVRGICDLFDGSVIDVRPKEAGTEGSGASP